MELRIITPEEAFLKAVEFNHDEIKQELTLRLEKYKGLVYNEEQIKNAKADRATLNKFREAIENKRKDIKKQCLAPYEIFESKVKELVALVDQPINEIDSQVKGYEEIQKSDKKLVIEGLYAESIGTLADILPLKRLWDEKWLNSGTKLNKIAEEIVTAIQKTANDLVVISQLQSEFELQIKDKYLLTLDLSAALSENTRLKEVKEKQAEYDRQEQAKRIAEADAKIAAEKARQLAAAERARLIGSGATLNQNAPTIEEVEQVVIVSPAPAVELEMIDFRVWVTPEQKSAMRDFFKLNQIKIGKVPTNLREVV